MPLIKPRSNSAEMHSPIVLHLGDLQREAERIEAEATARAKQIIDDARRERERLINDADQVGHKQGYERGHAEGLKAGHAEGHRQSIESTQNESRVLVDAWESALETFEHSREDILHDARTDILRLAALVAQKVTRRAVQLDPEVAANHIEAALELVQRPTRLTIRINPDDRPNAEEILPVTLQRLHHSTHAQLVDDPSLSRGSVMVSTEHGTIDASIDTQIDRLVDAILPGARPTRETTDTTSED